MRLKLSIPAIRLSWALGIVAAACTEDDSSTMAGPDLATTTAVISKIAFTSYNQGGSDFDAHIFTVNPDGSGLRQITQDGGYRDLDWAPGGAKIAAAAGTDIFAVNADGSGRRNLTRTLNADESHPVWSPTGSKIVYMRGGEVYVMNADGTNQRNLTKTTAFEREPNWSPDGSRIVYVKTMEGGNTGVHVMNADGSGKRRLSKSVTKWESHPRWSPDGRQIAFTAFRRGSVDVFVIYPNGTGETNLTKHPAGNGDALWSPKSTRIAFTTNRTGNPEVFTMGRWGGGKVNLTNTTSAGEVPYGWSPDGTRILYQSGPNLWVMRADGTQKRQINVRAAEYPVWSR
jgi:Tol biopolymer transport system component